MAMTKAQSAFHSATTGLAHNERLSHILRMMGTLTGSNPLSQQIDDWSEQTRQIFGMEHCLVSMLENQKILMFAKAGIGTFPLSCTPDKQVSADLLERRVPLCFSAQQLSGAIT